MAKINNQAVMQKLIDELKLYPGKDLIPSELAEKILPVFQINDVAVEVKEEGIYKTQAHSTANDNDVTFTVPSGKIWKINGQGYWYYSATASAGFRLPILQIKDADGNILHHIVKEGSIAAGSNSTMNMHSSVEEPTVEVATSGGNMSAIPLPKFTLEAGSTIRFYELGDIDANDDMIITFNIKELDIDEHFP